MKSKASIKEHPIHPMLIVFPVGLWVFSLVCDIIFAVTGNLVWAVVAYYNIGAGIIGALLAVVPGAIDLFSMRPSKMKNIGYWHMGLNLAVTALFAVSFIWRTVAAPVAVGPFVLSIIAVGVMTVSGWLGWEMVYRMGMAVTRGERPLEEKPEEPKLRRAA